jgi:hypothetical protein
MDRELLHGKPALVTGAAGAGGRSFALDVTARMPALRWRSRWHGNSATVLLASRLASCVNGVTLPVDGGKQAV